MASLIYNKKVSFNYEILEKMETSIELLGLEVKSLKDKKGSLEGTHITIRGAEAFVINMHIPAYQPANTSADYDEYRLRKLLLTKKEIAYLGEKENQRGLTIVPISVYNKNKRIKLEIAIVRGKKKTDKRQTIKKRDATRDIQRSLKNQ